MPLKGDMNESLKPALKEEMNVGPDLDIWIGSVWLIFSNGLINRKFNASGANGFKFHPHEH